ncbi:AAA family ATPase [Streptomyces sp. NPDC052040]|uniref:ATP-binding protein n=1 Tax=Streptomyces sp. NPDC052040 TaxID=3365682 RepID=UPI0037CEFFBD
MGRDREIDRLTHLLDRAAIGQGSPLVVRGEAGIGKSALLDVVGREAAARNLLVLRASGVESECRLAYAALHQVLYPLLDRVSGLPTAQRRALRTALGLEDGVTDVYTVALAALELIVDAASGRPVVVLVDDVHWVDTQSTDVFAFVARRIGSEPVFVLGATRVVDPADPLRRTGFPELCLGRLDDRAAAALLDASTPALAAPVRARILTEAAGNPLALVELPQVWDDVVPPGALPLNARLRAAFAARVDTLDAPARALLAILAADPRCGTGPLLAAAGEACGSPVGTHEVQQALDAGLIEPAGAEFRFRHPLMRSAIYAQSSLTERLAAHRALAAQLDDLPDRQLWHRAAAVLATDEDIAVQLEAYATRSRQRGAVMAAVAALRRAAELAEAAPRRTSLLLYAAELAGEVGQRSTAADLAAKADPRLLGPVERGRLLAVQEVVAPGELGDTARIRALIGHAHDARTAGDTTLAVNLLWRAASRCWWACVTPAVRQAVAEAVQPLALPPEDPRRLGILAFAQPEIHGRRALSLMRRLDTARVEGEALRFLCSTAVILGDYHRASAYVRTVAGACRASGQLAVLARTLGAGNWCRVWTGEWDRVRAEAQEAAELAEEIGDSFWALSAKVDLAMLAAQRGDHEAAEELAREAQGSPLVKGVAFMQCALQHARGTAALVAGRHEEAFTRLGRVFDPAGPAHHDQRWWAAPDFADAARHLGRQREARPVLKELEQVAERLPSPMMRMCRGYVRAVLADDDSAEQLFADALADDPDDWPLFHGRLLLAQGTWLRRQRRAARARESLRAARDAFDRLGAPYWSERARLELRAAGEYSGLRVPHARETLSPHELRIATMAAEGLTNRQIAACLYVSHRTVGAHLYRIFPKLGITSRAQLGTALRTAVADVAVGAEDQMPRIASAEGRGAADQHDDGRVTPVPGGGAQERSAENVVQFGP